MAVAFYQNVCHLGASVHVVAASLSSVALSPNQVLLLLFSAAEPGLAVGISWQCRCYSLLWCLGTWEMHRGVFCLWFFLGGGGRQEGGLFVLFLFFFSFRSKHKITWAHVDSSQWKMIQGSCICLWASSGCFLMLMDTLQLPNRYRAQCS